MRTRCARLAKFSDHHSNKPLVDRTAAAKRSWIAPTAHCTQSGEYAAPRTAPQHVPQTGRTAAYGLSRIGILMPLGVQTMQE